MYISVGDMTEQMKHDAQCNMPQVYIRMLHWPSCTTCIISQFSSALYVGHRYVCAVPAQCRANAAPLRGPVVPPSWHGIWHQVVPSAQLHQVMMTDTAVTRCDQGLVATITSIQTPWHCFYHMEHGVHTPCSINQTPVHGSNLVKS